MNQKKHPCSPCQQKKNTNAALALDTRATTGAQANGIAINTVTGILTDGQEFISGSLITFSISPSSSATFVNGDTQLSVNTDTLGEASVDLVDKTAENVIVTLDASAYGLTARASTTFKP